MIADALRSAEDALAQQIGTGIELTGRRKDGSEFPDRDHAQPAGKRRRNPGDGGDPRHHRAQEQPKRNLLHKVEELNRSNEELGQFAYIASHDLQEPLRMVASYTQLLSRRYKGKLDADADEFIAFAVDGASRMQRLIQDLLAYSRVGTKGQELVDISSEDALQQALINLRGAIEESGAQVTHDPLPERPGGRDAADPAISESRRQRHQVQKPGIPQVHISAAKNGGKKWIFSVKDNGLGIDPQYFEKNFRHVPAAAQARRVRRHRHRPGHLQEDRRAARRQHISVESQPGQGSTFRFALAESESEIMKSIGGDGMPIEVLLVEDSPGDVRLTQEAFRDANTSHPSARG